MPEHYLDLRQFLSKLENEGELKKNFRGEVAEPTGEMREMILKRWAEYGF
ncbi:MAG: hypothetical protein ACREQA_13840 [Candidatus Binatia bacterium]